MKNTKLIGKLSSLKELSSLKKEEEEEEKQSDLVEFLKSKDITEDNALKFEKKLNEKGINNYTNDDILESIYLSLDDFVNGKCDEPYIWAVGKLERLIDAKSKQNKSKTKKQSKNINTRTQSSEIIPDWFKDRKKNEVVELEPKQNVEFDLEKEKRELLESLNNNARV